MGFTANITVTNTGGTASDGWRLDWTFADGQVIGDSWNTVAIQSGAAVSAYDAQWNRMLSPGGSASFGFNATWSGANTTPASFHAERRGLQPGGRFEHADGDADQHANANHARRRRPRCRSNPAR